MRQLKQSETNKVNGGVSWQEIGYIGSLLAVTTSVITAALLYRLWNRGKDIEV